MDIVYSIIASVLLLVGLIGIVAPILPGIPLAFVGFLTYAIGTGFERISLVTAVVFGVVMVLILVLDFFAPALGAQKYRASRWAILGAMLGTIVGVIVFNVWGIILGPLLGAFIVEYIAKRNGAVAIRSAAGALVGFLAGALVKMVYLFVMAGFLISSWL